METNQTAVEWIIEQVYNSDWKNMSGEDKLKLFEQAKAMEKEQIIKSFNEGTFSTEEKISAEEYYNKNFKKDTNGE